MAKRSLCGTTEQELFFIRMNVDEIRRLLARRSVIARAVGLILAVALGYKLWATVATNGWTSDLTERFQTLLSPSSLGIIIGLVTINVLLEGSKWYWLLQGVMDRRWGDCVRDVLLGWGMGLLTPYRLGELVGRPMLLPSQARAIGLQRMGWNSLIQTAVTIAGALPALYLLLSSGGLFAFPMGFSFKVGWMLLGVLALLGVGYLLWCAVSVSMAGRWPVAWKRMGKSPSLRQLAVVSALAGLRYLVYMVLFAYLLDVMVPGKSLMHWMAALPLVFLLQTVVPIPGWLGFAARIEWAVLILQHYGAEVEGIALASALTWALNLLVPALVGSVWFALQVPSIRTAHA